MGFFDDRGDGRIVELDAVDGSVRMVLAFDPPERLRVPRKGFAGASWMHGAGSGDLLVCGAAAVYRFAADSLRHVGTLAQPSFNDLHGVTVAGDRIYVVNTGMDCIEGFDLDGHYLGTLGFEAPWLSGERQGGRYPAPDIWSALRRNGWAGSELDFKPEQPTDPYYSVDTRLPFHKRAQRDYVHPNHVCILDGRVLVTSLERRGVIDLFGWRQVISVDSPPHDGVVANGRHYLSRVDGFVEVRAVSDLGGPATVHDITALTGLTGWCRGLYIEDGLLWVGFTEIRRRPVHAWNRGAWDATQTAVVALDQSSLEVVATFDLAHPSRHAKVMGLIPPPASSSGPG